MSLNLMPNRVKYSIIYNGTETYFKTSPSGWDGEAMALSREDNYGLNRKIENELTFTKDGAKILRNIFLSGGYAAKAKLRIYTRSNLFVMNQFGEFDIDFSNYKYNYKKGVTIQTKNMDLYALWNTYKSTDYQLYYPTSGNDVKYIDYSGVTMWHNNLMQMTPWSDFTDYHLGGDGAAFYAIPHNRSTPEYTSDIQWVDPETEDFYVRPLCKATKEVIINAKIFLDLKITYSLLMGAGTPSMVLATAPDIGMDVGRTVIHKFDYTGGDAGTTGGEIFFNYDLTNFQFTLKKDWYLFFAFWIPGAKKESLDAMEIGNSINTYIDIYSYSSSGFSAYKIQAVTHEYLIRTILQRIYSDFWGTEKYPQLNFEVDFPYLDLISSTPAILQKPSNERYITTSLDKVLESLDKLRCIGLKFEGDTLTVCFRSECYPVSTNTQTIIPSHEIEEKTDDKYIYNKVSYGNDYSPNSDDSNGSYEFNAKNTATLKTNNVTDEKQYDLVLPFKTSCIEIENYMNNQLKSETSDTSSSTSIDTDIFMFACVNVKNNPENNPFYGLYRGYSVNPVSKLDSETLYNAPFSPRRILNAHLSFLAVTGWLNPQSIIWQSCDYDATFYCQMDYENAIIYEGNAPNNSGRYIDISNITPMFIPVIATCEIAKMIENITDIQGNEAYKEYQIYDMVNNRTYQGWADTISYDLDKRQARTLDLRLKQLPA